MVLQRTVTGQTALELFFPIYHNREPIIGHRVVFGSWSERAPAIECDLARDANKRAFVRLA